MLDELIAWGRIPPVIVADAGYGDSATFRQGLTGRELVYVVAVKGATLAHPGEAVPVAAACSGRDRPPTRRYPAAVTCKDLVLAAGAEVSTEVSWRHGTKTGPDNPALVMRSRFVALRVRPANRTIPRDEDGVLPQAWLLAEWPVGAAQPTDF
uniref:Transposase IS701-like DDE domain-containing protein n=1 Tax=Rhodococcus sp. NS1 TaxID=402236 RepID=A0A097SQZ1_9NOCA|nr:hypothetical protein LRS1606.491 [Rhodococcus sp. NS1]